MAKERKSKNKSNGLWACAKIEFYATVPATLTLHFFSPDDLMQFLRTVTRGRSDPPPQYPWTAEDADLPWNWKWDGNVVLLPKVNGRPPKKTHPLWDAYQKAKTKDPGLKRSPFLVRYCKLKRGDDAALRRLRSQLKREEKKALEEEIVL